MNKLTLSALFYACAATVTLQSAAFCDNMLQHNYDWIAEVETQQISNGPVYPGSALTPIVRARVNYFATSKPDQKTDYEDLYYSNGKPYGLQRSHPLDITQGEQIAIRIKHKNGTPSSKEASASANAALRVMLDAMLNRNMVTAILVPQSSFNMVSQSLQDQNCTPSAVVGEGDTMSSVDIFLKSEPAGPSQMFHYTK